MRRGRPPCPDVLTPREWEVLALIREGLTNPQIARRLGVTESSAKFHVSEILSKLGVESRGEAASWRGEPLTRVGLRAGLMARLSGALPRVALGLVATAVLALVALSLGVAVMERRGGQDGQLPRQQQATEQQRLEVTQLADEATAQARAVVPGSVLHLLAYAGGSGSYTFFFVEPDRSSDTVLFVFGPNDEPGVPRWENRAEDVPVPANPPLDVRSLQKTPIDVVKAAALTAHAPEQSTGVRVLVDATSSDLVWLASARQPGQPLEAWPIQCELRDAAPISTMTCNP
jgi:DNA-binding CsgD family transcriptional regulator